MRKTFTNTFSGLSPIFFKIPKKFKHEQNTASSKTVVQMKSAPSKLNLQIIMSYAAALQVVKCNEDVSFDLLMN